MGLLDNENIRLRALEPEDLDALYRWENNTDSWGVGYTLAPYSRFVLKEYIEQSHRDIFDLKQLRLMIECKNDEQVVGMIDLFDFDPAHRKAGVGILLDSEFRGKGIATEAVRILSVYAFSFLKLHQLYAHIPVTNEESLKLFKRCGFIETGRLTDWLYVSDGYKDVLVMQLIYQSDSNKD